MCDITFTLRIYELTLISGGGGDGGGDTGDKAASSVTTVEVAQVFVVVF